LLLFLVPDDDVEFLKVNINLLNVRYLAHQSPCSHLLVVPNLAAETLLNKTIKHCSFDSTLRPRLWRQKLLAQRASQKFQQLGTSYVNFSDRPPDNPTHNRQTVSTQLLKILFRNHFRFLLFRKSGGSLTSPTRFRF